MKKILIVCLSCFITLNLLGCSKVALEKEPIIIEDSSEAGIGESEPGVEQANPMNQENQDKETETESNSQETYGDAPSNDTVTSDTETEESKETFKGIIMLEGMEEEVNYRTYYSESGYQINYDVDRFPVTSENGVDTFMAENINPEIYPYVFFNIYKAEYTDDKREFTGNLQVLDKTTNKVLSNNAPKENVKIGDYDAIHYKYIDGNQWNSLVRHIYVISLEKDDYVIHSNYFLEAAEGYGARILAMLDTLIIDE